MIERRSRGGSPRGGALLVVAAVALAACKKPPPPPAAVPLPRTIAASAKPLVFAPTPVGFGVALPEGCGERAPSVRAPLEGRSVYFIVGDEPAEGAIVIDRVPEPAAVWASFRAPSRAAPLFDVEAPRLAFDGVRFRGLYAAGPTDARTVAVTNAAEPMPRLLATGDALSVIDFRCREARCVALLPRIGKVASAGISLLTGDASERAWARRDVDLGEGERPLGISALGASRRTSFATALGDDILVRDVDEATVKPHAPVALPFGVLDTTVLQGDRVVAIGHGARVTDGCATPKPLGTLAREGLPAIPVPLSAPLLHAIVRPLSRGGVLVYSAALRCHDDRRRVVTAQLLDETGAPRGPSMAVAEARGFAISTRGDEIDLVILRETEIVVAQARCPGG